MVPDTDFKVVKIDSNLYLGGTNFTTFECEDRIIIFGTGVCSFNYKSFWPKKNYHQSYFITNNKGTD